MNKPSVGITIAVWVYVDSNEGQQEIFQTIDPYADQNKHGQFYLELSDGQIRWFHRNSKGEVSLIVPLRKKANFTFVNFTFVIFEHIAQ